MKIKVWCDSGANIHSCKTKIVDIQVEFGFSDEYWRNMPEDEKEEICRDIAFERLDWGWQEIEDASN